MVREGGEQSLPGLRAWLNSKLTEHLMLPDLTAHLTHSHHHSGIILHTSVRDYTTLLLMFRNADSLEKLTSRREYTVDFVHRSKNTFLPTSVLNLQLFESS